MLSQKTAAGVLLAAIALASASPAAAKVERIELDIAGYLCGF